MIFLSFSIPFHSEMIWSLLTQQSFIFKRTVAKLKNHDPF